MYALSTLLYVCVYIYILGFIDCSIGSSLYHFHFLFLPADEVELTKTNWPGGKVFEWYVGPLFVMKEQLKGLQLNENEELCLAKLVMKSKNERTEDWDDNGFPSSDSVKKAQLQATIRRYV